MGMTSFEFSGFAALVSELWPKWAYVDPKSPEKSNWNLANQSNIGRLLNHYSLEDCRRGIRKQRLWDPDSTKPSWSSLLNDLRSVQSVRGKTPEEQEVDDQARRDTRRVLEWGRANVDRLDEIEQEIYQHRPRLRDAIVYARRLHGDARAWLCERWEAGDEFLDFADDDGLQPAFGSQEAIPF